MNGTAIGDSDNGSSSLMMTPVVKSHPSDVVDGSDETHDALHTSHEVASDAMAEADAVLADPTGPDPWEPSGNWWRDMLYFCGPGV